MKVRILFTIFILLIGTMMLSNTTTTSSPLIRTQTYTDHPNIVITGDNAFGDMGFPGSGTPEAPYLITGYRIDDTGVDLISISNTNASFTIFGNLLEFGDNGIYLSNVSNGQIYNNIIANNTVNGVKFVNSTNIDVMDNELGNNGDSICLNLGLNQIRPNTHLGNGGWVDPSSNINFYHNDIHDNYYNGLYINGSSNMKIQGNNVTGNGQECGSGLQRLNSLVSHMGIGIVIVDNSTSITLSNNNITDSKSYGVALDNQTFGITVSHNNFYNNNNGTVQIYDDGSNTISCNYYDDLVIGNNYTADGSATNVDTCQQTSTNLITATYTIPTFTLTPTTITSPTGNSVTSTNSSNGGGGGLLGSDTIFLLIFFSLVSVSYLYRKTNRR